MQDSRVAFQMVSSIIALGVGQILRRLASIAESSEDISIVDSYSRCHFNQSRTVGAGAGPRPSPAACIVVA